MTLKVHHLRPAPGAKTPKTRVGRGEGSRTQDAPAPPMVDLHHGRGDAATHRARIGNAQRTEFIGHDLFQTRLAHGEQIVARLISHDA